MSLPLSYPADDAGLTFSDLPEFTPGLEDSKTFLS